MSFPIGIRWLAFAVCSLIPAMALAHDSQEAAQDSLWLHLLTSWFPLLIIIGIWIFFMRVLSPGRVRYQQHIQRQAEHMDRVEHSLSQISEHLSRIADRDSGG